MSLVTFLSDSVRAGAQYTTVGGNLTVTLPSTVTTVSRVIVDNVYYSVGDAKGIGAAGTFDYDSTTNLLTVYPVVGQSPLAAGNLIYFADNNTGNIVTDRITDVPDFFRQYNFFGSVSINRTFKGHPAASMTIATTTSNEGVLRTSFRPGSEVSLYGIGFFVSGFRRIRFSPVTVPNDYLVFEIDLTGKWNSKGNTGRAVLDTPIKISDTNQTSLVDIMQRAGVTYAGEDLDIFLPKNAVNLVIPRQELENNAISLQGFIYYSDANSVQIRDWDRGIQKIISLDDLEGTEITFEENGYGALYGDVPLLEEFRNTLLTFNSTVDASGIQVLYEYENCNNRSELIQAPITFEGFEANLDSFRSANNAFDNGGLVKIERKITQVDGVTVKVEETKYGYLYLTYVFYTDQVGNVSRQFQLTSSLNLTPYWLVTEQTTRDRFFREDGYHRGDRTTGYIKGRYRKESQTEALDLRLELQELVNSGAPQTEIDKKQAELDTYAFLDLPISRTTTNTIDDFSNYYSDITADDSGVLPKFAKRVATYENTVTTTPDPSTADLSLVDPDRNPDLMTGREYRSSKDIIIQIPSAVDAEIRRPEKYSEIDRTQNTQGEQRQDSASIANRREFATRPPALERRVDYNVTSAVPETNYQSSVKYLLRTEGSGVTDDIERGNVSYPNIFDIDTALAVAGTDVSIRNVDAQVINITGKQRIEVDEGDFVNFDGNNWVVLGISENQEVSRFNGRGSLSVESFSLRLGRVLFPFVTLELV